MKVIFCYDFFILGNYGKFLKTGRFIVLFNNKNIKKGMKKSIQNEQIII